VWTSLRFAEQRGTAHATEPPMHNVPTIRHALKIGEFTFNGYRFGAKASIDGSTPGSQVLAKTTPADARDDGSGRNSIPNGPAQTPSRDHHGNSP
jgi:hypothetical protein